MEIELKFKLSPDDRKRVEAWLANCQPSVVADATRHEVTRYFDTARMDLFKAGFSLRVRAHGGEHVQTLKSLNGVARFEKEWTLGAGSGPEAAFLAGLEPVAGLGLDSLQPVFTTDIHRHPYRVALDGGTAELVIDTGTIRAGKAHEPVAEMEIELKSGAPSGLYGFAAALHGDMALIIAGESKAERGYRLNSGRQPQARKATALDLPPDVTMAEGLKAIVGNCLNQLTGNLAGVEAGDLESLHQLRVAARRLRSALVLFDHYLEPVAAGRFAEALRGFGQVLSPARDWDVFLSDTLPDAVAANHERAWLELLSAPAAEAREAAYEEARALIGSAAFTGFVLAVAGWVEGSLWARTPDDHGQTGRQLRKQARDMLGRLADKAYKRGRRLEKSSLEELHGLRKTLKKLRYGGEFLADLFDADRLKQYNHACKDLLERLGLINDTETTDMIAGRLAAGDRAHLAPAVSLLARRSAERREAALAELPKAWARFEKADPFWK